jgi:hypothetical protein
MRDGRRPGALRPYPALTGRRPVALRPTLSSGLPLSGVFTWITKDEYTFKNEKCKYKAEKFLIISNKTGYKRHECAFEIGE